MGVGKALEGSGIVGTGIVGAGIVGAALEGVGIEGVDLEGAGIEGVDLAGATVVGGCVDVVVTTLPGTVVIPRTLGFGGATTLLGDVGVLSPRTRAWCAWYAKGPATAAVTEVEVANAMTMRATTNPPWERRCARHEFPPSRLTGAIVTTPSRAAYG